MNKMPMKLILSCVMALSLTGCSDFFNPTVVESPQGSGFGGFGKMEEVGENPFPENYDPNEGEFSEQKMLAHLGLNVVYPKVKRLRLEVESLDFRIGELCKQLESGTSSQSDLQAARSQWKNAMGAFHKVSALPVGPLLENEQLALDSLYSWPSTDFCGIDVSVERMSKTDLKIDQLMISIKGLDALEYVLFETDMKSACNLSSPLLKKVKEWVEKPELEKQKDRCKYAAGLSKDLFQVSSWLERAWDPKKRNYSKELSEGTGFGSLNLAVNAVSDGLFAIEEVKDERLGVPLGVAEGCSGICPERVEHLLSQMGFDAIEQRIAGFKEALFGASTTDVKAFAFDDFLKSKGHSSVVATLKEKIQNVETSLKAARSEGSLHDLIKNSSGCMNSSSPEKICVLFWSVKDLSTRLKTDLLSALSLKAPPVYQGDND